MGLIAFVGRLLFVAIFLASALDKFSNYDSTTGGPATAYMAPKLDHFLKQVQVHAGVDIPVPKEHYPTLVLVAGALEAVGSLLFISNSKLGSVLLLAFLIPTTVIMHNFWEAPNEQAHLIEMIQFMKNLAMAGALLMHLGTSGRSRHAGKSKLD